MAYSRNPEEISDDKGVSRGIIEKVKDYIQESRILTKACICVSFLVSSVSFHILSISVTAISEALRSASTFATIISVGSACACFGFSVTSLPNFLRPLNKFRFSRLTVEDVEALRIADIFILNTHSYTESACMSSPISTEELSHARDCVAP